MSKTSKAGEAHIEGDEIVIRLPFANLQSAALGGWANQNLPAMFIDNPARFAVAFCNALNAEDEIGDTPIHGIFDEATEKAFEDGAGMEVNDKAAETIMDWLRRGILDEKVAEITMRAIKKYNEECMNVSGRPAWSDLDPNEMYDMGMRETAFELVFAEMGWLVE